MPPCYVMCILLSTKHIKCFILGAPNNSMGQCQLMLEDNEKNNKKNSITQICRYGGSKGAALISFILNIKKNLDYLSFTNQWHNNSERL
jgi:hypothetical protein